MKDSYLIAGMRFFPLLRLLRRNRFSITPKNLLRILFLLQSSLWSSFFAKIDRLHFGRKVDKVPCPDDPVFIIGHWRTGSTYLHQLMALDPGMIAPSLFQVAIPDGFLSSHMYYRPLMKAIFSKHRPMDNVKLGPDEPQEDEYAIFRLTEHSPLTKLIFPEKDSYFPTDPGLFLPENSGQDHWEAQVCYFFRKLSFHSGKRVVSKNPFHSYRIPELARMFPEARFIHIYRNPEDVIPSTRHLWKIVTKQNSLRRKCGQPGISQLVSGLRKMAETIHEEQGKMRKERFAEVRYEELESDSAGTVERLYRALELPFTAEFRERMLKFTEENKGYEKNRFELAPDEREYIRKELSPLMSRWGYDK